MQELIESLSPIERKIIPYINESFDEIVEKSALDRVSVLRALEFLNSKKIIELKISKNKTVDLGVNGIRYVKKGLPERQLLYVIENKILSTEEILKHIDSVTSAQIQQVAKEVFVADKMNLTLVGPFKDKKLFKDILSKIELLKKDGEYQNHELETLAVWLANYIKKHCVFENIEKIAAEFCLITHK